MGCKKLRPVFFILDKYPPVGNIINFIFILTCRPTANTLKTDIEDTQYLALLWCGAFIGSILFGVRI